jgi:osmotically-inducible protein OsmY
VNMRSDSDIKHNVEAELRCCPNVDETDIAVKVTGGTVTLTGYVRNFFHKYGAEDAVKRVAGVAAIANDIQVQAPESAAVSDPELARDAVAAIKRQLPLYWEQIRPIVHQGMVTLEGVVDQPYQREEAEGAVRRVRGVVSVVNAIGLAPSMPAVQPEYVKGLIEESFRRSGRGDASGISVEVNGAEVALRGRVRAWPERSQAERSARSAQGVQSVRNELTVQLENPTDHDGVQQIRIDPNGADREIWVPSNPSKGFSCKEKRHESDPLGTIHRNG